MNFNDLQGIASLATQLQAALKNSSGNTLQDAASIVQVVQGHLNRPNCSSATGNCPRNNPAHDIASLVQLAHGILSPANGSSATRHCPTNSRGEHASRSGRSSNSPTMRHRSDNRSQGH